MGNNPFIRNEMILGEGATERLAAKRVAVFGLGGVGGYVVEALARAGVGALDLIDHDRIDPSNLNRQILATRESIGEEKVALAEARVHAINPDCRVRTYPLFFLADDGGFDFHEFDYVVDAIDTVTGKIALAEAAQAAGVPIISSMGTGNKLDPTAFRVADIYETSICPLAKAMRKLCRERGIRALKCVYSTEPPKAATRPPGSVPFVPPVAGFVIAGAVIRDLLGISDEKI